MQQVEFIPLTSQGRGSILRMLQLAYRGLPQLDAALFARWEPGWAEYDALIFDNPATVGACGFVACLDGKPLGFASYDPRQRPLAIVGHNCILPAFRGKGYGIAQMKEVVRRIRERGFACARVSTGDHPAFVPAQKMYRACGFVETRRFENADSKMVEFEIKYTA